MLTKILMILVAILILTGMVKNKRTERRYLTTNTLLGVVIVLLVVAIVTNFLK